MTFPGVALLLTVLAFNLVGDGLQDALNPRARALMSCPTGAEQCTCATTKEQSHEERSLRWTLFAAAARRARVGRVRPVAAARQQRQQQAANSQQRRPENSGQEGRNGHLPGRLPTSTTLDPGQTYYTFGFMVAYAINRPLYSFKPRGLDQADPGPRRRPPADLVRQQDHHGQDQARASSTRRRSTARSRPPTSSTPSSGPSPSRFRRATPALLRLHRRHAREVQHGQLQAHLGPADAGQVHVGHQAPRRRPRRWCRRRW